MPDQLLFIGHSLVGYKMPEMLNSMVGTLGLDVRVDKQVINGSPLRYNWDNGDWAEGVNARTVLPSGNYAAVIITEALPLAGQITWNDTHGYATRYYDLARAANPASQFYIYETWHNISGNGVAWRAALDDDLSIWEGIADAVNAQAPNGANPALIVPAGQAMARLYDAISAGEIPGVNSIYDVFEDTIHLNDLGNWFISTLQMATVLGVNPAAVPAETTGSYGIRYDAPDADLAAALSQIIVETLASYDRDGRDGDLTVPIDNGDGPVDDGEPDNGADDPGAENPGPDGGADDTPDAPDVPEVPDNGNPDGPHVGTSGEIAFGLGFGLSSVADFVSNMPFLNIFKTSRDFIGHEPGRWGGVDNDSLVALGAVDADGWPTFIPNGVDYIGTLILTSLPAEMTEAAGRYRVTWEGDGVLNVGLSAYDVTIGDNEAWFSYTPNGSGTVSVEILSTDPQGTGNYIRNISVVKQEYTSAFDAGETFNPVWLDVIKDAHSLRFMDWMETNNSTISSVADMPKVSDASWGIEGVPLEIMILLANETDTDPWFTIPHLADEAYIRAFVTEVRNTLDPELRPYFEFSNEVWNFQFDQSYHSHIEGQARFPGEGTAWVQNYAADAVVMARIIDEIYGANSNNVTKVIATHTGWQGLESSILDAPAWVAENPALNAAPATYFDAYAITGYFDGGLGRGSKPYTVKNWLAESQTRAENAADSLGLSGSARSDYIDDHQYDYATHVAARELRDGSVTGEIGGSLLDLRGQFAYHKSVADARGLELVMYEGGTHIVGVGEWQTDAELTAFFTHLNYTSEMADLYSDLLQMWEEEGGTLFNAFTAVGAPSQYGSWGHLRYLGDENPRMDVVVDFMADHPRSDHDSAPVDVENQPPRGTPVITGDLLEGEVLTADMRQVTDPDGIEAGSLDFQWLRDGSEISGATHETYVLMQADVDAEMAVIVRFTDGKGDIETVQSAGSDKVVNQNDSPQGSLLIQGAAREGALLTLNWSAIGDADGIDQTSISFQWFRDDEPIGGANGPTYLLRQADAGSSISAAFRYRDDFGRLEEVISGPVGDIANVNDTPEGRLILRGDLEVGAEIVADITGVVDLDGIVTSTGRFQWYQDGREVLNATGATYTARQEDVGSRLSVTYSYEDAFGRSERVVGNSAALISDAPDVTGVSVRLTGIGEPGEVLSADAVGDTSGIDMSSITWNWLRSDIFGQQSNDLLGETTSQYQITDRDQGYMISVELSYSDGFGAINVASSETYLVNSLPVGEITIVGRPAPSEYIAVSRANLTDIDGIDAASVRYQWLINDDVISGATQERYQVRTVDIGGDISAQMTYLDDAGFSQSIVSAARVVSAGPRQVDGTNFSESLFGSDGDDMLNALDGDDLLISGSGYDFLDGGTGVDTAVFKGNQSSYTLRLAKLETTLTDRKSDSAGGQGDASLTSIEKLDFESKIGLFSGSTIPLDIFGRATSVSSKDLADITELYVAYFNRAPDAIGLTFWAAQFANGLDLSQLANSFFDQPETRLEYADMLSADGARLADIEGFVTRVYANVLGRTPDPDGFAFWVDQLESQQHVQPSTFILSVLGGAKEPAFPTEQTALDQAYIATKTDIGTYFAAIKGLSDVSDAADVMSLFDGSADSVIRAVAQVDSIYADALDSTDGEFLLQLVGVANDPFPEFF